jgi:hypothetical protein
VQSQNDANRWSVSENGGGCFVFRKIGSGRFQDVTDVEIYAIFDQTLNLSHSQPPSASEIDVEQRNLQIQIVPPFPSWYLLEAESFTVELNGKLAVPLIRNATFDSDPRPRFDFIGFAAEELSRKIGDDEDVELAIQYGLKDKVTISLPVGEISAGEAILKSCISKVH